MATTERPYKPVTLLNWKGMRRWSAGRRAPSLCKLFMKAKSSSVSCKLLAMGKLLKQATPSSSPQSSPSASSSSSSSSNSDVKASSAAKPPSLSTTQNSATQESVSMQRSISYSNNNNSVVVGAMAIANCLRRHSDAIAPQGQRGNLSLTRRFSVDSAHPYYARDYIKNEEERATRPTVKRLGSCEKADNFSSMGSPMVAKMKDTYARFVHTASQQNSTRHPLDLLVGNPFLTRVNPAPVSSMLMVDAHHLNVAPSSGFLTTTVKSRDSELKDRIVFFL